MRWNDTRIGRDHETGRFIHRVGVESLGQLRALLEDAPKGFVALVVWDVEGAPIEVVGDFAEALVESPCGYVCAWGRGCSLVDDVVDETCVEYELDGKLPELGDGDVLMTTWHDDESFDEALDFAVRLAEPTDHFRGERTDVLLIEIGAYHYDTIIQESLRVRFEGVDDPEDEELVDPLEDTDTSRSDRSGRAATAPLAFLALGALVALCIVVALATLWFAQPVDDDFDFALDGAQGAFAFAADQYANWSGRWAGFAVLGGTLASVDPVRAYPWLLLATWSVLLLGVASCVRAFLGSAHTTGRTLGLALALCAILWLTDDPTPIADALFWFPGSVTYAVSLGLALLAIGLLARVEVGVGRVAVAAIAAFLAPAFHEVVGVLLVLALAALLACGPRPTSRLARRGAWIALAFASIGSAIVVLAPGNGERAALTFDEGVGFAAGLDGALHRVTHHGWWWLRDLAFWGAVACAFAFARRGRDDLRAALAGAARRPVALAACAVVFGAGALAVPAFVTGGWIPPRMVFVGHALFVLFALATAASLGARRPRPAAPRLEWAALALLALGTAYESNLRRGVADLVDGRPQRFAAAQAERRAAAAAGGVVVLRPLESRPRLLRGSVMADDPEHWANRRFADYFGAASVVVRD